MLQNDFPPPSEPTKAEARAFVTVASKPAKPDGSTSANGGKNSPTTGDSTSNGFVYAAFYDGKLKGFVSVESEMFGGKQGYCDLSSIHISEDMRRKGIGRTLFLAAKEWAKQKGAKKLYISAHSAVESQAFYKSMGCVEAEVYNQKHVEDEPYDCQLECSL